MKSPYFELLVVALLRQPVRSHAALLAGLPQLLRSQGLDALPEDLQAERRGRSEIALGEVDKH